MPTLKEIEAAQTPAGGWKKKQLAEWGVPWPPPKGWKKALASGISPAAIRRKADKIKSKKEKAHGDR